MRTLCIVISMLLCYSSGAQILLRNIEGEQLFSPSLQGNQKGTLLSISSGTQSLGLDYIFTTKASNPSDYKVLRLGVAARATEGVGTLLTKGQFSPGVKLSGALTKIPLFASKLIDNKKFDDWVTFSPGFTFDKYKLFRNDTNFKSQVIDTSFNSFSFNIDYTMVFGKEEQDYVNIRLGYARRNNFSDLTSVEVYDTRNIFDSASNTTRIVAKKVTAKEGKYSEFEALPWGISYTHLPKFEPKILLNPDKTEQKEKKTETVTEDVTVLGITMRVTKKIEKEVPKENPRYKALKLGYSIYFNSVAVNNDKPDSKLGLLFFLISPNKDDILTPRLGVNFQFNDPFDIKNVNNSLIKRLQIGLTATIAL